MSEHRSTKSEYMAHIIDALDNHGCGLQERYDYPDYIEKLQAWVHMMADSHPENIPDDYQPTRRREEQSTMGHDLPGLIEKIRRA